MKKKEVKKETLNLNDVHCERNRELSDADIQGMAASIGNTTLLNPLILHEYKKGKLEVVAGRCRYFALMKLKRYELPPEDYKIINTEDAGLISFIENFERRQLSLLEESEQIGQLLLHHDVAEIATILGRSEKYVRFRTSINKLTDDWKKALTTGHPYFKAGHYEAISRFPESIQKEIKKTFYNWGNVGSVQNFTETLDIKYSRLLKTASFDNSKCFDCPKCSNQEPWLFEELKDDKDSTCLDPECWNKKIKTHVKRIVKWLRENGMQSSNGNEITLVCNHYFHGSEPPYKGAIDKLDFEIIEMDVKVPERNAFIVSGDNVGHYCKIRLNEKPGKEPAAPMEPEDKERRAEGRRVKKSITKLYNKIQNSKFERPGDPALLKLAALFFVDNASLDQLREKDRSPEDIRNDIWKSVVDNIWAQLHSHTHAPLVKIDPAYGEIACSILGLSWKDFETEE